MSLKIIGGEFGGLPLKSVRGMGTRPLLGQVREALFNILAEDIDGALVWDLFAGSGASGMEALSRGAARVLFCEKNGRAVEVLKANLATLGPEAVDSTVVLRTDAWDPPVVHRGIFGPGREADDRDDGDAPLADDDLPEGGDVEIAPDVVLLDPPYSMVAEDPVKSMARARGLLDRTATNGCVVFHFQAGVLDEDDFDGDLDVDLREWGSTAIAFLWRGGEAPERVRRKLNKETEEAGASD